MKSPKKVTIHYRKLARKPGTSPTLEEMVRTAMAKPGNRKIALRSRYLERLYQNGSDNYFVNLYEDIQSGESCVFGDVLHYTDGHLQALCQTTDPEAESVPIHQLQAPSESQYVHSQMFWMIKNDHVFIIQSISLKTAELEDYLSWLLHRKAAVLSDQIPVQLGAKFDIEKIGGKIDDIKEIVVGGITASAPPVSSPSPEYVEKTTEYVSQEHLEQGKKTGRDTAYEVLSVLLGGDAKVDSVLAAIPADAELDVQVHIGYKTRKRKTERIAMNQLETGLRHIPDSQLQVIAKGTKQGKDGSVRISHDAYVRLIRIPNREDEAYGSLLDPSDVLRAMIDAYAEMVARGKISE